MSQNVIAVTGISGVGKTTFVRNLADQISVQHLTGGSLIAGARAGTGVSREALRQLDLDENQRLLIKGFMAMRDRSAKTVVFDGHSVIDTQDGLSEIPIVVFKALGISLMVHLEADPVAIKLNRQRDSGRARPVLDIDTLRRHQMRSKQHAISIALALGIECLTLQATDDASALLARIQIRI